MTLSDHPEEDRPVEGEVVRVMAGNGIWLPLWDSAGPVPEFAEWAQRELGASKRTVHDLMTWAAEVNAVEDDRSSSQETHDRHRRVGRALADRLSVELAGRFTVRYKG